MCCDEKLTGKGTLIKVMSLHVTLGHLSGFRTGSIGHDAYLRAKPLPPVQLLNLAAYNELFFRYKMRLLQSRLDCKQRIPSLCSPFCDVMSNRHSTVILNILVLTRYSPHPQPAHLLPTSQWTGRGCLHNSHSYSGVDFSVSVDMLHEIVEPKMNVLRSIPNSQTIIAILDMVILKEDIGTARGESCVC